MAEGIASGRIVETEAYVVDAAAGHAYRGMTPRNRSLFPERGYAYVYLAYGSAYMLNVSSEVAGIGAGVLIRALEPRDGIPIMQRNRQIERLRDLARGPGRLTAALRVDRRFDGLDLCREGPLWLGQSRAIAINRCAVSSPNRRSAILASRPRPVAASARKASARRTAKASQGHQIEIKTPKRKPAGARKSATPSRTRTRFDRGKNTAHWCRQTLASRAPLAGWSSDAIRGRARLRRAPE